MKIILFLTLNLLIFSLVACTKLINPTQTDLPLETEVASITPRSISPPTPTNPQPVHGLGEFILPEDILPDYLYYDVHQNPDFKPGMANPWVVEGSEVKDWFYIPIGYQKLNMDNVTGFLSVTYTPDDPLQSVGYFVIQSTNLTPAEIETYKQYLVMQQKERYRLFIDGNQLVLAWSNTNPPALQKLADQLKSQFTLTSFPIELTKQAGNPFGTFSFDLTDDYPLVWQFNRCQQDKECDTLNVKQICQRCPNGRLVFSKGCQEIPGITEAPPGWGLCTQEHMLGAGYEGFFNGECMTGTVFCLIPIQGYQVPTVYPEVAHKYFPMWMEAILSAPGMNEQYYQDHFLVQFADSYQSSLENPTFFNTGYQFVFDWIDLQQIYTVRIRNAGETELLDDVQVRNQFTPLTQLHTITQVLSQTQVQSILDEGCYPNMQYDLVRGIGYELEQNLLWLRAYAIINENENQCKQAKINLVSGEILSCEDIACAVP
jgi:hypothetical protein